MSPHRFQIVGRDELVALTRAVVRGADTAPPAVLLVGESGIGKTALLHFAVRAADDQLCVVFAAGVAGESHGYAALAGLLWPVLPSAATLPHALRDALTEAMHGPPAVARPALIRDAVIAVLEAAAVERPVLLVIDDVDLFNDEMRDLLVGVAAQLITTRVRAVLTAHRRDVLAGVGRALRTVEIGPLSARDSALLVDSQPEQPNPSVRGEIIRWSRGNPLALIEFTRAYARNGTSTFHGATLSGGAGTHPLFADRIAALPADTRRLLLFAAAGTGRETVDAVTAAAGLGSHFAAWEPARRDGYVEFTDERRIVFAHALLRAAAYASGDFGEQRAAHLALAATTGLEASARAWHLGSAAPGSDEMIAAMLEATASQSAPRADELERARALQRAAELSPDRVDAARRYALAAGAANFAGDPAWALSMTEMPLRESDDPNVTGYAALIRASILLQSGRAGDAFAVVDTVLAGIWPDDGHLVLALLYSASGAAYYTGDVEHRRRLRGWLDRVGATPPRPSGFPLPFPPAAADFQLAYVGMYADTAAADARPVLPAPVDRPTAPELEPFRRLIGGTMAFAADDTATAATELAGAIESLSAAGGLRGFGFAVAPLAWSLLDTGRWTKLAEMLDEAAELCAVVLGSTLVERETLACQAQWMAMRGDVDGATVAVSRARESAAAAGGPPCVTEVNLHRAAGWIDVATGDYDAAYRRFRAMFDADGRPVHFVVSHRALADLAWSAARSGRIEEAAPLVAAIGRGLGSTPPVRLRLLRHQATALTTDGHLAERHYKLAVFDPAGEQWPLERARARLHYGEWLRRARRPAEARPLLAAALEVFERLGAEPLAGIARAELRAAGVTTTSTEDAGDLLGALTAQERQIVTLAASGLTNREIAERLRLSPRTVASHLYHVYPKLGVSRRHELREFTS